MLILSQDSIMALNQKFDQMTTEILQTQATLLNRITILERERDQPQNFPPRPQYNNNHQPRGNQGVE
jgi:hypothetical protein